MYKFVILFIFQGIPLYYVQRRSFMETFKKLLKDCIAYCKDKDNLVLTIICVLLIIPGAFFMWLVDLIFILMGGEPFLC